MAAVGWLRGGCLADPEERLAARQLEKRAMRFTVISPDQTLRGPQHSWLCRTVVPASQVFFCANRRGGLGAIKDREGRWQVVRRARNSIANGT